MMISTIVRANFNFDFLYKKVQLVELKIVAEETQCIVRDRLGIYYLLHNKQDYLSGSAKIMGIKYYFLKNGKRITPYCEWFYVKIKDIEEIQNDTK